MENSSEFKKVVIEKNLELDIAKMRQGVLDAVISLPRKYLGAIVLECTNLISFRSDIQKTMGVPVFDFVTVIEFYVSALRFHPFHSWFIDPHCSL